MKNNRGFTLVELLAVIVILLAISLAAGWGVTSILEDRKNKECMEQKALAIGAAKIYFSKENKTSVKISKLKEDNYFVNNKKVDELDDDDVISLNATATTYKDAYKYTGTKCPNE